MRAQSISLYYTGGTSDKVYNVQLLPDAEGTWGVFAQNGRRGQGLTSRTKVEKVSFPHARRVYNELVESKLRHASTPYYEGPLNGDSAKALPTPVATVPSSASSLTMTMPTWQGWDNSLGEAALLLSVPMSALHGTSVAAQLTLAATVIVSDLLDGLPEGGSDVIRLCEKGTAAVESALSPECSAWFQELSAARRMEVLNHVRSSAHLTVT